MADPWPRDAFAREVWASSLKPNQRLVALAYADHAADQDHAWVTYPRLQERTGLSRDAIARALDGLREHGWLVLKEASRQQRSARYWLRVPDQPPASQTAGYPQPSVSRTAETTSPLPPGPLEESSPLPPDTSPLPPDTSSPGDGPDHSSHHSSHKTSDDAEAVATILASHSPHLTETEANAAVSKIHAWAKRKDDPIADIVSFVSTRSLEDLQRWAGRRTPRPTPAEPRRRRCDNGVLVASDGSCCAECATEDHEAAS